MLNDGWYFNHIWSKAENGTNRLSARLELKRIEAETIPNSLWANPANEQDRNMNAE